MLVFFNAASLNSQGASLYEGGQLLMKMMATVESLLAIGAEPAKMYRDSEVHNRPIVPGHSFKQVLIALQQQIKREEEVQLQQPAKGEEQPDLLPLALRFSQFLSYLTQLPLAYEKFTGLEFNCLYGDRDVSYEAAGYAAHFTKEIFEGTGSAAAIVSLEGCPPFDEEWLAVTYMHGGNTEADRKVWNVFSHTHPQAVARTFEHNSKHDYAQTLSDGTQIAAMDLRGKRKKEGQQLLNRAVKLRLPNKNEDEGRLFARYNGRIYIFPCHLIEQRVYHGYPVEPAEARQRMSDICSALYRQFGWEELKV